VPLAEASAPLTFELADKAEKFGVPQKLVHAIAIATFLLVKGGKLSPKNRRGHTPIDHVFDPLAKAFLLDTVAQLKSAKQQNAQASNVPTASPSRTVAAASALQPAERCPPSPFECRICCETLPRVTFEPCGHQIVCNDCSKRMKKCIECDTLITNKICPNSPTDSGPKSDRLLHALEAKVQDLEDRFLCSICMERNKTIVFLCGHGACSACSETLNTCHMCRSVITKKIFLY
jgi:E3 ubiquitin-protein ligase mind-bomb